MQIQQRKKRETYVALIQLETLTEFFQSQRQDHIF